MVVGWWCVTCGVLTQVVLHFVVSGVITIIFPDVCLFVSIRAVVRSGAVSLALMSGRLGCVVGVGCVSRGCCVHLLCYFC